MNNVLFWVALISFGLLSFAEEIPKKKILIGSPVRQKPLVLKEFLQSLARLKKTNITVDYCFVEDNQLEESTHILSDFVKRASSNSCIYNPAIESEKYVCNETTHHWSEELINKVSNFKNMIIEKALKENYDYLFLIDSDIVLNPNTLEHLISLNKDIVSNIFWTKWYPHLAPGPQVWLYDEFTQWEVWSEEPLTPEATNKSFNDFITQLHYPGTYEVGGLGACTLISHTALAKGVNFKDLPSIGFLGEDRHFCIRAAALDIGLFVDTRFPAYHIYRESELSGVAEYIANNN